MPPLDLAFLISRDALGSFIPACDVSLRIEHHDRVIFHAFNQQSKALLARPKRFFNPPPLHRIAQRARRRQSLLPLHQIILNPHAHRLKRQPLILHPGQHHDRHARRRRADPPNRFQAAAFRKRQIQRDHIGLANCQRCLRRFQTGGVFHSKAPSIRFTQRLHQQPRIRRAVFDQQNSNGLK